MIYYYENVIAATILISTITVSYIKEMSRLPDVTRLDAKADNLKFVTIKTAIYI